LDRHPLHRWAKIGLCLPACSFPSVVPAESVAHPTTTAQADDLDSTRRSCYDGWVASDSLPVAATRRPRANKLAHATQCNPSFELRRTNSECGGVLRVLPAHAAFLRWVALGETIAAMEDADRRQVKELIALARAEDLGDGDLTTSLLGDSDDPVRFQLLAKECGVLAGVDVAGDVLATYDPRLEIQWSPSMKDGVMMAPAPVELAIVSGPLCSLLSAERVLLNFLQRLCGIATLARRFVEAVAGSSARIYDTRKTIPGWRVLDKYAVACGGGCNHRMGLHDAVMIKDNHLAGVTDECLASAVFEMLNRLSERAVKPTFVAVEADRIGQVCQLLKVVGLDVIVLDNFSIDELVEAVAIREKEGLAGKVAFEASGGVNLTTVAAIAATGVERISVGRLTHSAVALDLSLERI